MSHKSFHEFTWEPPDAGGLKVDIEYSYSPAYTGSDATPDDEASVSIETMTINGCECSGWLFEIIDVDALQAEILRQHDA